MSPDRNGPGAVESEVSGAIAIVRRFGDEAPAPPETLGVPTHVLDAFKVTSTLGDGRPVIRLRGLRDPARTLVVLQYEDGELCALRLARAGDGWFVAMPPWVPDAVAVVVFVLQFEQVSDAEAVEWRWGPREATTAEPSPDLGLDGQGFGAPIGGIIFLDDERPDLGGLLGDVARGPVGTDRRPEPPRPPRRKAKGGTGSKGAKPKGTRAAPRAVADDAAELTEPERVLANIQAEMPAQVVVGQPVTVLVKLSQSPLEAAPGADAADAAILVDRTRDVRVTVALRGFKLAPGVHRTRTLRLPEKPTDEDACRFTVIGVDPGRGHVTVVVRQDAEFPLATLRLSSTITQRATANAREIVKARVTDPDRSLVDLPTLRIDEDLAKGRSKIRIAITIGGTTVTCEKTLNDKAAYVSQLYEEIAVIRRDAEKHDEPARRREAITRLQRKGAEMFQFLLDEKARSFLWTNRGSLHGIFLQTTGEFDLPWELVHPVAPGSTPDETTEPCFLAYEGLTRWVYDTAVTCTSVLTSRRARYLCPNYRTESLRLTRMPDERAYVRRTLGARAVKPGTGTGLAALFESGFDVLHFAGHGVWSTDMPPVQRLLLERYRDGDVSETSSFSDAELRIHLPERPPDPGAAPLVFVNACSVGRLEGPSGLGGFPEAFLRGGAGAFIGCTWAVGDDPATDFVTGFYDALVRDRKTVAEATIAGRTAARGSADLTDLAYTVYAHPHARMAR